MAHLVKSMDAEKTLCGQPVKNVDSITTKFIGMDDDCDFCKKARTEKIPPTERAHTAAANLADMLAPVPPDVIKLQAELADRAPDFKESSIVRALNPMAAPAGLTGDLKKTWDIYESAKCTAIKKNLAYGSSVFKVGAISPDASADLAIRVRMGDKISRIANLLQRPDTNNIADESLRDTFMDLGTYCFLYLIATDKKSK